MIILDTNVLSEPTKASPSPVVRTWFSCQPARELYISTISVAEILIGVGRLPEGKRKDVLRAPVESMFAEFEGRILAFDEAAARDYANVDRERRAMGRPISQADAMIAAIARSHGATLATRNEAGFQGCGIRVVNPWERSPA